MEETSQGAASPARSATGTHILVADDDADIRDLVAFKLTNAGYEVEAVPDGLAALESARARPPRLVVLDVMMPGLSGLDVTQQLRAEAATATVPVILLTAKAQEADVEGGFGVGADDYVTKPFSPRELLSRVRAVLARSGS
ncbi:response regulator [Actinotalea sp. AC32]|nr:response regulator [Actinotalea sp. AC32]